MSSSDPLSSRGDDDLTCFEESMSMFRDMVRYDPSNGSDVADDDAKLTEADKADDSLKVLKVDLDIKANTKTHNTGQYDIADSEAYNDIEHLVVRRGQQFNMKIKFSKPYDETKDDLRLIFEFGRNPLPWKGSRVEFILTDKDLPNEWGAWITKKDDQWLNIAVATPPTCAVAKWRLKIDVIKQNDKKAKVYRYRHRDPLYILFNPWCKDDEVYQEKHKDEYVLNDTGILYRGSKTKISEKPWDFGQFSECVMPCVMDLLGDKSTLRDSQRGDAVQVVRQLSSLLNSNDNDGVLKGKWHGNYDDGKLPSNWNGSVKILAQYIITKRPVKYGQCWVFSGLMTTACRALGIPTRSVTNFASAHDTDASCTIDTYYTRYFEVSDETSDSVWNFHVWNEVWMCRKDLPSDFSGSGWQVIDATPQELSGGVFCMGPFPTEAIKQGVVYLPYDGHFAFAEVNADRCYWYTGAGGKLVLLNTSKDSVGKNISTKKAGTKEREDITLQYKFPEGKEAERTAVRRANIYTNKRVYESKEGDVKVSMDFNDDTFIGDTIKLVLKIVNTGIGKRTVSGNVKIATAFYTGKFYKEVRKQDVKDMVLKAKEETSILLEAPFDEYMDKLQAELDLKMLFGFEVDETKQIISGLDDRRLRKPHLNIKAPKEINNKKKFEAIVSFLNPLPIALTGCELEVDGPGLQETATFKQNDVKAKGTFTAKFELTPEKAGEKEIIVCFNSAELTNVNTSALVHVSK